MSIPTRRKQAFRDRDNTPLSTINNNRESDDCFISLKNLESFALILTSYPALIALIYQRYNMHYPGPLRRLGVVPGLVRLIAIILEVLSLVLLCLRHDPEYDWTTSYVIVSILVTFWARAF